MSFTLSTNPPISSSAATSEFNSQATSSVNSGAVNSALLATQASNASFRVDMYNSSYVDPTSGQLYAAGSNGHGTLGLGYDEDGNGIKGSQQSFTPLYKSGDASQPFINPIDWDFGHITGIVIDADGKVWTTGYQGHGQLGNGFITTEPWCYQYTFEMVEINGSYDYTAVKVGVEGYTTYTSTIVMLDDGTIWGAGYYAALGLSWNGGYNTDGSEGGAYYHTFTQIDNTSEDAAIRYEMPFDAKDIVDFKVGAYNTIYLLEDGSLWRCNTNGYALVGSDVVSFDLFWTASYYVTYTGDVYYASNATNAFNQILSAGDYEGTIDSIYTGSLSSKWAYLTTTGDVYYATSSSGDLFKIAEDVIYFAMGGYTGDVFGAITKSGEFKLWGNDSGNSSGILGNGATEGDNLVDPENALDAFESEEATPSTPTTDGNNVVVPAVDAETGELQKDEDGNNVAIIPTLQTPAPAKKKRLKLAVIFLLFCFIFLFALKCF